MKMGRVLAISSLMVVGFVLFAVMVAAGASVETDATASVQQQGGRITPTPTITGTTGTRRKVIVRTSPFGDVGTGNIDVTLLDPNVTAQGMPAIAFQVLARAQDTTEDGAFIGSVEFIIFDDRAALDDFDENGTLDRAVYQHTENNKPYCLFRESGNDCAELNFARASTWPASDDSSIPRRQVQFGRTHYMVIQITSGDNPDFNGFWEGVAEFTPIQAGRSGGTPAQGCRTGRVQIRSPRTNSRLSDVVSIRGTATCDHFDYYKFEFEDSRCDKGICFVAGPFRSPVVNDELMEWDTTTIPNGRYTLRLVVVGQNGAIYRTIARIRVNIAN